MTSDSLWATIVFFVFVFCRNAQYKYNQFDPNERQKLPEQARTAASEKGAAVQTLSGAILAPRIQTQARQDGQGSSTRGPRGTYESQYARKTKSRRQKKEPPCEPGFLSFQYPPISVRKTQHNMKKVGRKATNSETLTRLLYPLFKKCFYFFLWNLY